MHPGPVYPATPTIVVRPSCVRTPERVPRQSGASLIEFSIVMVPVLLAGLGIIEIAQWFFTKQAVSLALLEAGRAASVDHANPKTIELAFERAIQPLYTSASGQPASSRLHTALQQRQLATGAAPWQIEVLSPSAAAFTDFSQPGLQIDGAQGLAAINNHYLAEQHERLRNQGWLNGQGPQSNITIFQANTLVLRASWLHQPIVPGVSELLRMLGKPHGSYSQHAMALGGYLPIKQELALVMQSHPANWPALANGKVTGPEMLSTVVADGTPIDPCIGIWCARNWQATSPPGNGSPGGPSISGPDHIPDTPAPPSSQPPGTPLDPDGNAPPWELPDLDPTDPACGVSLCCVS